jgi:hypothetical protein
MCDQVSISSPPKIEIRLTTSIATLTMTGHVVNLYMHEVAMHVDHNVDEFKPPFTEDALRTVTPDQGSLSTAHISALSSCLASIDGIFECFLTFDVDTVRCLPVGHFVRVAYAVVVLIKMYFAAAAPNSELGKVINKDDMKVDYYLDRLVDIFKASAAEEKSRPSTKFLMVLVMLKTWFVRQREGKQSESSSQPSESREYTAFTASPLPTDSMAIKGPEYDGASHGLQQIPPHVSNYNPANTPLQLLSEVATGNSGGQHGLSRPDAAGNYAAPSGDWQQNQQQSAFPSYDTLGMNNPNPSMIPGYGMANMGGNLDPSLGMEFGYAMGDGFEQAMGMTLGLGDFGGTYFTDDTFFGNVMDSVGGNAGGAVFEGA